MKTTVDKFGRVIIPKKIRDDFNLTAGTVLDIQEFDEFVTLKPFLDLNQVITKDGVLVFCGSAHGDLSSAVTKHRQQHLNAVTGL